MELLPLDDVEKELTPSSLEVLPVLKKLNGLAVSVVCLTSGAAHD